MAIMRQFKPGQLQTGSLYPISASYALTASFLSGSVSFNTGSLVTTASFNAFTASYTTGSFTGSFTGDGSQLTGIVSSKWTGSNPISRQSDVEITGSLRVQGNITGSLFGTASWATNAVTASYVQTAQTASFVTLAQTSSLALRASGSLTGSLLGTATTASYVLNAVSSSYATNAVTASYIVTAQTASYVLNAVSSSFSQTASYIQTAQTASYVLQAVSASYTTTASYVLPLTQNVIITGSLNISGSTTQIGTNNLLGQTNLSGSIYVSGSMNALADLTLAGTLRLDPAQDPGGTNLTASFLFTSASNTEQGYDLYYRQYGNLVKFKWLEGGISTGLLYGGIISASGATIYVSSGSGVILDPNASFSKEINPQFTYVTWPNYSASATYLTSSQNTYIYVDSVGTIHQQTEFFDQTQYEQAIPLGRATHPNYATITGVGSNVQTTYDSDSQQSAFIRAFGPLKIDGFSINAHPGTLGFGIGNGVAYTMGGFYPQDPNSPSHYHGNAFATASIARAYRSGSGVRLDNNGGAFYTTVDPDYWDDGTGVLNTMAAGDWQIQRVFANPVTGRVVVYYGQNIYTTKINALQYLATDSFTEGEFTAHSLIFVGYLVLKGQTNNLTDATNNSIINSGIFRNIAGSSTSGGAIAQTLDDLGDVTITTPSNGQALIYNSGTWENGTPSFATSASFASTASYIVTAQTASYVLNAVSASFATSASFAVSASRAISASFASTASFVTPLNQNVLITGSINITQNITGSRMFLSASSNMNSGSTLTIYGSGSTQPVFTVQGLQGELFSVTDSLSGSLFSVNDISGLPILEVFSDNTTLIGNYLDPMLITTAKVTQTNSGSFVLYSLPTASYDTAFFEYSVRSGSNARAGTIMAIQSGSAVNFTETTTTDFGSTSAISFVVVVTGSAMALTGSSTSGAWTIKTIVRGL
jgi:hypothetical protein